ncbi:MAG: FAD-dependent oxidoreductase [Phycisphaerae bacterium]|nr:FAD-dependent oxidoreductase [Phycisphaerae bacterium]
MSGRSAYDLAVMGGGSGGVAAALAAARLGLRVVVVERGAMFGGTATQGGVNCWEAGVGGTGVPFDIYRRVQRDCPAAIGVYSIGRHFAWQDGWHWPHDLEKVNFPGGEHLIDHGRRYTDSLRRHPGCNVVPDEHWKREHWHGVSFLPQAMADTVAAMLEETGNVDFRLGSAIGTVSSRSRRIESVRLSDGSALRASAWVDACAGRLCDAAGCETLQGVDPKERFDEPSAPQASSDRLNAVSLIYKIDPGYPEAVEPLPDDVPAEGCWWADHFPPMSCVQYPDMGRHCNMLPTMEGAEFSKLGEQAAYEECRRRVKAHWHFVQHHWPEFRTYRMTWIAPMLGIREQLRVVCERMLTEHDVRRGFSQQRDPDIIALADHALDRHGAGGGCQELNEPYGVPFPCLVPKGGWVNLLVAGRSAGFSSIAASSCRLSRTMMQLGQAVGTAAALAQKNRLTLPEVAPDALRDALRKQHVQLEWPMSAALTEHVRAENKETTSDQSIEAPPNGAPDG